VDSEKMNYIVVAMIIYLGLPKLPPPASLSTNDQSSPIPIILDQAQLSGTVRLTLPSSTSSTTTNTNGGSSTTTIEVSVDALTTALTNEIRALRSELLSLRTQRESELKTNLLTYIQALPEKELERLTTNMSEDIIQSIELLVNSIMLKLGIDSTTGVEVVVQQSIVQLAQLCMWQMVVGYKLRELEALDKGATLE
jgi:hypothetical protein